MVSGGENVELKSDEKLNSDFFVGIWSNFIIMSLFREEKLWK